MRSTFTLASFTRPPTGGRTLTCRQQTWPEAKANAPMRGAGRQCSHAAGHRHRLTLAAFRRPRAGGLTFTCSQRAWPASIEAVAPMRGATDSTLPVCVCGPLFASTMLGDACSSSPGLPVKSTWPPPATPECPCISVHSHEHGTAD